MENQTNGLIQISGDINCYFYLLKQCIYLINRIKSEL